MEIPQNRPMDRVVLFVAVLCGLVLAALSVARYEGYNAGLLDLGVMAQSIWSGTEGQPLVHTAPDIGQRSRLNVHIELVYFLFVPFYALWPDPRLLVIVQAGLFTLGAWPVYRLAYRRTGSVFAARCLSLVYLFYPTAQTSVLFDFHGDTLALPLLLFALDALDTRAWRRYALFGALALSCKFYVALPLAAIGFLLAVGGPAMFPPDQTVGRGERRAGWITMLVAVLYGGFAFLVVRSLFAPGTSVANEATGTYITYYFGNMRVFWESAGRRLVNAVIVFGPAMLVAWRGWRWLLPGVPVALAVLVSTGPEVYDFNYHHYALVVPFIVMAAIDGTRIMMERQASRATKPRRGWRGTLGLTTAIVLLFTILLVDIPLNPMFWMAPPGWGLDHTRYGILPRDAMKDRFLAEEVHPHAPMAASNMLSPHLANREVLYLVRYLDEPELERFPAILSKVDTVLADALFEYHYTADFEREAIAIALRDPDFGLVAARDGLLLFERDTPPERVLEQRVEVVSAAEATEAEQGGAPSLVAAQIVPVDKRRYRATFEWDIPAVPAQPIVAVSRLRGVEQARMVHLPTYALYPSQEWQAGERVREVFDVELPADIAPGRYQWEVGWYRLRERDSFATDERSRVPGSRRVPVTVLDVE